jgi:3-oxoacyl-[acyl-carrier-protein] synthase III
LTADTVLEIIAQGAWNGGTVVDNSIYENKGMAFKGNIPVNHQTIMDRIGVRTRVVAADDERIGVLAFKDLLHTSNIDPAHIKLVIGATNIGEDKFDPGPLIRHPFNLVKNCCPDALVLDLYAGCPGFNVAVEMVFMLSLAGVLKPGDLSIIVGAENVHRAKVFPPGDTSNIIFGDDAMATALETKSFASNAMDCLTAKVKFNAGRNVAHGIANALLKMKGPDQIDGIIIDNQLGKLEHRVPATAVRVQHQLVKQTYPQSVAEGTFKNFRSALTFYDQHVNSFAFDIMTPGRRPDQVAGIANAYVSAGKYNTIAAAYLSPDHNVVLSLHEGGGRSCYRPRWGIVDSLTRTHGCFAHYIEVQPFKARKDMFGKMDGKGVFLHATRSASRHLAELLSPNNLRIDDIDLLYEHQANFAMIPLTLEQVLVDGHTDIKKAVSAVVANKMVTNIHVRGNCSVVCMQRLPYDLQRGVLRPDSIQGFGVNQNLENLKGARTIVYDSIGAGMTRSSFLQRKKPDASTPAQSKTS